MAETGPSGLVPTKKGKKERAGPRQRRRLRKSWSSSGSIEGAPELKTARWVRVSPFVPTLSWDATASNKSRGELNNASHMVQHTVPPGKHRATSARLDEFDNLRHQTEESFGECPASPFTPSQHLLPASLLSLTVSSENTTPGRRPVPVLSYVPTNPSVPGQSRVGNKTALQAKEMTLQSDQDPRRSFSFMNSSKESWATRQMVTSTPQERGPQVGHATRALEDQGHKEDEGYFIISRQMASASCRYQGSIRKQAEGRELDANTTKLLVRPHSDLGEYALNLDCELDHDTVPEDGYMRDNVGKLIDICKNELEVAEESEEAERKRWQEWAKHAAEHERQRRIKVMEAMDREEHRERLARRAWALSAMDEEQRRRASQQGTNWFQETISSVDLDYDVVCPYSSLGCRHTCLRTELEEHLANNCRFNKEPHDSDDTDTQAYASEYEVVCPNTILGCDHSCSRSSLAQHLDTCRFSGPDISEEKAERARSLEMVLQQAEEERARRVADDARGDWQTDSLALKTRQFLHRLLEDQMKAALVLLHKEIEDFAARCRQVQERRKKALEDIWSRLEHVIGLLWPGASVIPYGSFASGMIMPQSDVDLVVFHRGGREGCCGNRQRQDRARDHEYHYQFSQASSGPGPGASSPAVNAKDGLQNNHFPGMPQGIQEDVNRRKVSEGGIPSHLKQEEPLAPTKGSRNASPENAEHNRNLNLNLKVDKSLERRRGNHTDVLSRIHDLADHLRHHAPFIEVVKVLDHARVPIIKAVATTTSNGDSSGTTDDMLGGFKLDISIDGPTHTGLATTAFVCYLVDHLPNLVPLTIVLKFLLQRKALNDPFTGGLSSYGLVLMVAFALLRRDTFSTAANTTRTNTNTAVETQTRPDDRELNRGPLPSPMGRADSPRKDECGRGCACEDAPPSPSQGHSPCSPPSLALAKQSKCFSGKAGRTIGLSSLGRQRGFWQRSSLSENRSTAMAMLAAHTQKIVGTGEGRPSAAEGRDAFNVDVFWDRPQQQCWLGSRTARAILLQDFYAGTPSPAPAVEDRDIRPPPTEHSGSCPHTEVGMEGEVASSPVPPPSPPPLPQPVAEDSIFAMAAPRSPYITSGEEPILGHLLLDFLQLFGEDFDVSKEGFSVRGGGFRFRCYDKPPHPQAGDPIVIEDPLNCMNNVGRSSYCIGQVQRVFFEALTTLKAAMVRVNQDGKEVLASGNSTDSPKGPKSGTGLLRHICSLDDCEWQEKT